MQSILYLAALLGAANAHSMMEELRHVPEGWHSVGVPDASRYLHFRIAMTEPKESLFEQTLLDISTPGHARYGQHLKREELKEMLRPSADATSAVTEWLHNAGIGQIEENGEWINFIATTSQAESLLDTQFTTYRHELSNIDKVRTLHYSIPEELHRYIDMIQPTTRFGEMRSQRSQVLDVKRLGSARSKTLAANSTGCNNAITPDCLKQLYSISGVQVQDNATAGFAAFTNYLEEYPRYADLATFEDKYAPYAVSENFTWSSVNGGKLDQTSSKDSVEANLDLEYLLSVGYPVPIHAYSTAGRAKLIPDLDQPNANDSSNEPYLDFLNYIMDQPDNELPHTLSTSYGEDEQSVPLQYRKTVCNMFGQLGARGVSIIFSSGDTGVGSACQTNDGKNTTRFLPIFPAACPYVTSVGGTYHVEPEEAVSFSSGGFSDTWSRPSWQDAAVSKYLDILGDQWKGLYNPNGRGFPDVAAQGYNFHVIDKGDDTLVGGTSASAPTFAGVVSLLNAARIGAGMSPLGFLNPWIYSKGYQGLTDIVNGGSTGCTGRDIYSGLPAPKVPFASWNATQGWDPVTGYGTPNFQKLLALSMGNSTSNSTVHRRVPKPFVH